MGERADHAENLRPKGALLVPRSPPRATAASVQDAGGIRPGREIRSHLRRPHDVPLGALASGFGAGARAAHQGYGVPRWRERNFRRRGPSCQSHDLGKGAQAVPEIAADRNDGYAATLRRQAARRSFRGHLPRAEHQRANRFGLAGASEYQIRQPKFENERGSHPLRRFFDEGVGEGRHRKGGGLRRFRLSAVCSGHAGDFLRGGRCAFAAGGRKDARVRHLSRACRRLHDNT